MTGAAAGHDCRELASSGWWCAVHCSIPILRSLVLGLGARDMGADVEDLIDGTGSAAATELDVASVNVESVEVRKGDFLVMGSHDAWTRLDGNEAVRAGQWVDAGTRIG